MKIRKLGENSEFSSYHPLVNLLYFFLVIGTAMFSLSPYFLICSLFFSWAYGLLLKGKRGARMNFILSVPLLAVMVLINMFFNNNGETVLFYVNTNRITMEAIAYGFAAGIMLVSVVVWFSCFNVIMTADKLIYLFGRAAPVLGLTLSMIFRFIPLLKDRFSEISLGQKCMAMEAGRNGPISKIRQLVKEISILIAWSLEASIESADSMEARGYGLKGRTSFHLYKLTYRDVAAMIFMTVCAVPVAVVLFGGSADIYFYPKIVLPALRAPAIIAAACYAMISLTPILIDIAGEIRWKRLELNM